MPSEPIPASEPIAVTNRGYSELDSDEMRFVQDHGKKCFRQQKDVDQNKLWSAYRNEFPNWQRPGEKLKKYWNNFKDGAAFKCNTYANSFSSG